MTTTWTTVYSEQPYTPDDVTLDDRTLDDRALDGRTLDGRALDDSTPDDRTLEKCSVGGSSLFPPSPRPPVSARETRRVIDAWAISRPRLTLRRAPPFPNPGGGDMPTRLDHRQEDRDQEVKTQIAWNLNASDPV